MSFYEQIAPYYDLIFPAGREQLEFIKSAAGAPPKRLLDIACGAGTYSVALAAAGYEVRATDLDPEMIRRTNIRAAAENATVKAEVMDMLHLDKYIAGKFDCVFCIGNSIVHLGSREAILAAVLQMKRRMEPEGSLLLQIINFDRIIARGITSLPSITNAEAGLEFHRNYSFDADTGLIGFDTELHVVQEGRREHFSNKVQLFPLVSSDLRDILERVGFNRNRFYGGFSRERYAAEESYLLVSESKI